VVAFEAVAAIRDEMCFVKCPGVDPATDPLCEGYDETFLSEQNALCVTRATCEELCQNTAECVSIDMHKTKPRCYLNTVADCDLQTSEFYNHAVKQEREHCFETKHSRFCPLRNLNAVEGDLPAVEAHQCLTKCAAEVAAGKQEVCRDRKLNNGNSWEEANGNTCMDYQRFRYCTDSGQPTQAYMDAHGGTFSPSEDGTVASEACCACGGGGARSEVVAAVLLPDGQSGCVDDCYCEGALGLDPASDLDRQALCLPRERCEEECAARVDCRSFDMHRTLPRCYLNTDDVACDAVTDTMVTDDDYDFVLRQNPQACSPVVSYVPSVAHAAYSDVQAQLLSLAGTYSRSVGNADVFEKTGASITWDGCQWIFRSGAAKVAMSKPNTPFINSITCAVADQVDRDTAGLAMLDDSELYLTSCPRRPGMVMQRRCIGDSVCPILTRCDLRDTNMHVEMAHYRVRTTPGYDQSSRRRRSDPLAQEPDPGYDKTVFFALECQTWIAEMTRSNAKQLASPSRAEFVVDIAEYGPHLWNFMIFRDVPAAPLSRFNHLGVETLRGVITSVAAAETLAEYGTEVVAPDGFDGFLSDVIRVERLPGDDEQCGCSDPVEIEFEVYLDPYCKDYDDWEDDNDRSCADYAANNLCTSDGCLGTGWTTGTFESVVTDQQPANVACCSCGGGDRYQGRGDRQFMVAQWSHDFADYTLVPATRKPPARRSIDLRPTGQQHDATSGWWTVRADVGCPAHFAVVVDVDECAEGTATCEDTADCVNTVGNYTCVCKPGFYESELGCLPIAVDCDPVRVRISHAEPLHFGWRVREVIAYADEECTEIASAGLTFESSPAFTDHPVSLVGANTEFAEDSSTVDNHMITEFWSDCHSCDKEQAWIELLLDGFDCSVPGCRSNRVGSVRVVQDPRNAAEELLVSQYIGMASRVAVPESVGSRPDWARQDSNMPPQWTAEWRLATTQTGCYSLACGEKNVRTNGEAFTAIEGVSSACRCKQLCMDRVGEGCSSWRYYHEEDFNFDTSPETHCHQVCYLLTEDFGPAQKIPAANFSAGAIDTIITTATTSPALVLSGQEFSLTVHGYALPSGDRRQRLKLVYEDHDCDAELPHTVIGLGCANKNVCSPRPQSSSMTSATFDKLAIAGMAENRGYKVCYCKGPCFAGWQYTAVPGFVLRVGPAPFSFAVEGASTTAVTTGQPLQPALNRKTGDFAVRVHRRPFHTYTDPSQWLIKIVKAPFKSYVSDDLQNGCSETPSTVFSNTLLTARRLEETNASCTSRRLQTVPTQGWSAAMTRGKDQAVWSTSIDSDSDSANGLYLVCLCEEAILGGYDSQYAGDDGEEPDGLTCGSRWIQVPSTHGNKYLNVTARSEDMLPQAGPHLSQRWSTQQEWSNGRWEGPDFDIEVAGYHMTPSDYGNLGLFPEGTDCLPAFTGVTASVAKTAGVSDKLTYRIESSNGIANFDQYMYQVCLLTAAGEAMSLGLLSITRRAKVGRMFVLEPDTEQSIEISGVDLDYDRDRIMIIDSESSCGIASPTAELMPAQDSVSMLRTFNGMEARTEVVTDDHHHDAVDLPSVLDIYSAVVQRYCFSNNIDLNGHAAAARQCHAQCSAESASMETSTVCAGYMADVDTATTDALCATRAQCEAACTADADCYGVDMHRTLPRCYLNTRLGCQHQVETGALAIDESYDFLVKKESGSVAQPIDAASSIVISRQTVSTVKTAPGRRLHTVDSYVGISSSTLLRFAPIRLRSGGSYKVCFCDHESLEDGQAHCRGEADYKIEVGQVHVSGVTCLIREERFRRQNCRTMMFGGLECGDDLVEATVTQPTTYTPTDVPSVWNLMTSVP